MKVSVIIPVFNGLPYLKDTISACCRQHVEFDFEIVIVDSGSTDGSLEFVKSFAVESDCNINIFTIDKSEFQHGRTRNFAISKSVGEYLCVITQDAIPHNIYWLNSFIDAMDSFPDAAGAFGRHVGHVGSSKVVGDGLDRHFSRFGSDVTEYRVEDLERYFSDVAYRQFMHFFSDNNACLRRSVWDSIPYPEVDFGEDQLWADSILREGLSKLYVPNAIVRHSHDYSFFEVLARSRIESFFFARHFGYDLNPGWRSVLAAIVGLNKQPRSDVIARMIGHSLGSKKNIIRFGGKYEDF